MQLRSFKICSLASVAFLFAACSPSTPPPSLNTAQLPVQQCASLSMNLKEMKPAHVRSLLNCMNADGKIAPLAAYANELTDAEMQPLLDMYNLSIGGFGNRLDQNIALFDRAQSAGLLTPLFQNLSVLLDSDLIQNLGSAILNSMNADERAELRKGLLAVASKKQLDGLLLLGSQLTASTRAQLVAQLLAASASADDSARKAVTAKMANTLHLLSSSGDLKNLLISVEDPSLIQMLKFNPDQAADVNQFARWLAENPSVVELRSGRLARLMKFLDRPLKCFVDDKQGTATNISNILEFYMAENSRVVHSDGSLQYADQAKMRLLLSVAMSKCDLSDSDRTQLQEGLDELSEISAGGVGPGKSLLCSRFYDGKRVGDLKSLLSAQSFLPVMDLLSHANVAGALDPMVSLVLADVPQSAWTLGQTSLQAFREAGGVDSMMSWLARVSLVDGDVDASSLGKAARALIRSWNAPNYGVGGMLQTMIQISSQSTVAPLQDALVTSLSNADGFDRAWISLGSALDKKTAQAGLHTLALMARDGRLTSLIRFMIAYQQSDGRMPEMGAPQNLGPATNWTAVPNRDFKQSPDTRKFLSCQKVSGPMFDPSDLNGQHILDAVTCLNADADFPAVLRATQTLEQDGKLATFKQVLDTGILNSNFIPGAKEELSSASKSGVLRDTLNFLRIGDAQGIYSNVEGLLATVLSDKSRREAPMQCMAALLSDPSTPFGLSKVFEIAKVKDETPFIRLNHQFVEKLGSQEIGVKDQAWAKAQSEMSRPEFEKQFNRAKNEFESRSFNSDYYNRTALYPKYTDEQMVRNLYGLGKDLIKDRNLEEMLFALQDLSSWTETGELDMDKFLNTIVGTYRGIIFHNPDGTAEVRIASIMDQMEILVRSTDVSMAKSIPLFGIGHMSTFYEVHVALANNLVLTLQALQAAAQAGQIYTTFFEREKHFTLQNAVDNFYVLVDFAKTGELRVFQRIYQGLMRSTPPEYRQTYDKDLNDISFIHRPMDYQFFGHLQPILEQLREQGELKDVVDGVFHAAKMLRPEDFPKLREIMTMMVNSRITVNGPTYLEYILNCLKYENTIAPVEFSKIVRQFYESIPVADRLISDGGPIVGAVLEMMKSPTLFKRAVDAAFTDILNPGSELQKVTSHFMKMPSTDQQLLRRLVFDLTFPNYNSMDALPKVGALIAEAYDAKPREVNAVINGWPTWRNAAAAQSLSWPDLGQRWLDIPTAPAPGVKALTLNLLSDGPTRGTLIEISADLAAHAVLAPMIHDILGAHHIEEAIRLLTDGFHFSKSPGSVVPSSAPVALQRLAH